MSEIYILRIGIGIHDKKWKNQVDVITFICCTGCSFFRKLQNHRFCGRDMMTIIISLPGLNAYVVMSRFHSWRELRIVCWFTYLVKVAFYSSTCFTAGWASEADICAAGLCVRRAVWRSPRFTAIAGWSTDRVMVINLSVFNTCTKYSLISAYCLQNEGYFVGCLTIHWHYSRRLESNCYNAHHKAK